MHVFMVIVVASVRGVCTWPHHTHVPSAQCLFYISLAIDNAHWIANGNCSVQKEKKRKKTSENGKCKEMGNPEAKDSPND